MQFLLVRLRKTYNGIPLKVDYHCNIIPSGATKSIHRFWNMCIFAFQLISWFLVQLKELTISVIGILHIVKFPCPSLCMLPNHSTAELLLLIAPTSSRYNAKPHVASSFVALSRFYLWYYVCHLKFKCVVHFLFVLLNWQKELKSFSFMVHDKVFIVFSIHFSRYFSFIFAASFLSTERRG
jgi:hypothetical protein